MFFDRWKFADMMKLRILTWKDYPGLSQCFNYNHKSLYKGGKNIKRPYEDAGREEDTSMVWKMEEGAPSHGVQAASRCWRNDSTDSALEPLKEPGLPTPYLDKCGSI